MCFKMRKLGLLGLIFLAFILGGKNGFAQKSVTISSTYKLEAKTLKQVKSYYANALDKANMESYRLKNDDVVISFKDGAKCILYSASRMSNQGMKINLSDYKNKFPEEFTLPIFSVHQSGHLLADYKKKLK